MMILTNQLVERLQHHHLFAGLSDDQWQPLLNSHTRTTLANGEPVFFQGDSASQFYFVAQGSIRLFRSTPSGHEKVIDLVNENNCFAEALMFTGQPIYPVNADAVGKSEIIGFKNSVFRELLQSNNDACLALLGQMSQRLHHQLLEIENLSLQNALHRLVNFLLQKINAQGETFTLGLPKRLLASRLGIQPETLSRLLRQLADQQAITVKKDVISVLNKEHLLGLASDNQPLRAPIK